MNRKEQLTVKFYSGKDNIPCAWIESKRIAGFKYQLKTESFNGLLNYLCKGIVDDFDKNPTEFDTIQEGEDFQFKITTHSTLEGLPEKLVLNFVGKYTKVEYGLLKSKQLTFKFRGNGYNGYLVLNPKFYIPDEKRFTPEKAEKIAAVIEERRVQVGRGSNAC